MKPGLSCLLPSLVAVFLNAQLAAEAHAQNGTLALAGVALDIPAESPTAGVYIHGNLAYVGGHSSGYSTAANIGVRIVDLSDPGNPGLIGRIPLRTRGRFESHAHGDALATRISTDVFQGDIAIVQNGVPDTFAPDEYPEPFGIWDVTDPGNPEFLSVLNLGSSPHGIEGGSLGDKPYDAKAVAGNYLFAIYDNSTRTRKMPRVDWDDHLAVVDLSDPRNPVVVAEWQDDPAVWLAGVSVNESATKVYVTGFSGTDPEWVGEGFVYVLDVQDRTRPTELGRYAFPVHNVDVSIARPTSDDAIVVLADHGWSAPDCGILHFLDTSDPTAIHKISEFALPESSSCDRNNWYIATDVAIRGNTVYSTWLKGGVRAIDISDPANPVEVGQFDAPPSTSTSISDVACLGDDYVVATIVWGAGLYILRDQANTRTSVEEEVTTPASFDLSQNYPNPFNSSTVIRFSLAQPAEVELSVYDLAGQKLTTMLQGHRQPGTYRLQWDGRDDEGRELASGAYLYRLRTGGGLVETRKLLLLR